MRRRVREEDVSLMVERFYGRVRDHDRLGGVFAGRIADGAWPTHLARMVAFWSTVLLGTGSYRGDPMSAHRSVPDIVRSDFTSWLVLFEEVVRELFERDVADAILARAHRMGDSLTASLGL